MANICFIRLFIDRIMKVTPEDHSLEPNICQGTPSTVVSTGVMLSLGEATDIATAFALLFASLV